MNKKYLVIGLFYSLMGCAHEAAKNFEAFGNAWVEESKDSKYDYSVWLKSLPSAVYNLDKSEDRAKMAKELLREKCSSIDVISERSMPHGSLGKPVNLWELLIKCSKNRGNE